MQTDLRSDCRLDQKLTPYGIQVVEVVPDGIDQGHGLGARDVDVGKVSGDTARLNLTLMLPVQRRVGHSTVGIEHSQTQRFSGLLVWQSLDTCPNPFVVSGKNGYRFTAQPGEAVKRRERYTVLQLPCWI